MTTSLALKVKLFNHEFSTIFTESKHRTCNVKLPLWTYSLTDRLVMMVKRSRKMLLHTDSFPIFHSPWSVSLVPWNASMVVWFSKNVSRICRRKLKLVYTLMSFFSIKSGDSALKCMSSHYLLAVLHIREPSLVKIGFMIFSCSSVNM